MNNDLISRNDLKERAKTMLKIIGEDNLSDYEQGKKYAFETAIDFIDNAPTVELFCAYLSDGEVRQPCVEAPCKHERPQDDLISRSELKAFIKKYYKQTSQIKSLLSFIDTQKDGARMTDHKCFTLHRNKTTCDVCGADLNAVK